LGPAAECNGLRDVSENLVGRGVIAPESVRRETSRSQGHLLTPRLSAAAVRPLDPELQISAHLLVHVSRQPRLDSSDEGLESLCQEGMARALGTTPASASHALGRLVDGGLLEVRKCHVHGKGRRVRIYQLTPEGEAVVQHILIRMALHSTGPDAP